MTRQSKFDGQVVCKAPAVELKRAPDAEGILEGYAACWSQDRDGETIAPGAFAKSIRTAMPKLLWGHDRTKPIGRVLSLAEDSVGLRFRAQLNLDTAAGREAHASMKAGDVDAFSVGFITRKRQGNNLLELELLEISAVTIPANPDAKVIAVKEVATPPETKAQLRDVLKRAGLSRSLAEKAADLAWPAIGEAEDEEPSCHFCGSEERLFQKQHKLICAPCALSVGDAVRRHSIDYKSISARLDRTLNVKKGN
jgi:HK97 family phage prohead protease